MLKDYSCAFKNEIPLPNEHSFILLEVRVNYTVNT